MLAFGFAIMNVSACSTVCSKVFGEGSIPTCESERGRNFGFFPKNKLGLSFLPNWVDPPCLVPFGKGTAAPLAGLTPCITEHIFPSFIMATDWQAYVPHSHLFPPTPTVSKYLYAEFVNASQVASVVPNLFTHQLGNYLVGSS
jgi:hypothetical protein